MKIQNKLFFILFSFSLFLVTTLVLLTQWSLGKGMIEYVNTKQAEELKPVVIELTKHYKKYGNWDKLLDRHDIFHRLIVDKKITEELDSKRFHIPPHRQPRDRGPRHRGPREHQPQPRKSRDENRRFNGPPNKKPPLINGDLHYALLDAKQHTIVGNYSKELDYSKTDIIINNSTVGYFAVSKKEQLTQGYEFEFIKKQQRYLWGIEFLVMLFVALVTIPLSRHIVEPIKSIARGIHRLTQGNYEHTIDLERKDELGKLSSDYNDLAITLSENEAARKRWLANISHELRTPVAILRGELEAMLDDIRPLTKENISSATDEVKHLQRLIDDLHQLTSADVGGMRYQKAHHSITELLTNEFNKYDGYLADAGIKLHFETTTQNFTVYGDKTRLCQLFENIINNAIKYSKSTELKIHLNAEVLKEKNYVSVIFEDNGIGVDEVHLDNLFEYLYRVDDSRNRKDGGAGLGLSICRQIVMAHKGEITAKRSLLGGLAIIIKLPIN